MEKDTHTKKERTKENQMIMSSKKISYVAQELSNNESSTDDEMILDIAQVAGVHPEKAAKLVKEQRTYFLNHICDYTDIILSYLK